MGRKKNEIVIEVEGSPILDVEYKEGFHVECYNLLETPDVMHLHKKGYKKININTARNRDDEGENDNILDVRLIEEEKTQVIVVLQYFEYICLATIKFNYIVEILNGGFSLADALDMVKHHLRNKLTREVKGTEQIVEMHIKYLGYVRY